ncbi:MAG: threonine/serine dehydratase [Rhizobiales bacterium]|nr:threonine/serine dehydratase [Hyphomicrobiales bacterium]MBO6697711.1 threonine/serine dehydratase [Hyphomicrobiales bacterium]MBO6736034.1 threonine/serine dehydratase [Hyphomicrobiales bacterium]MBO6912504.1 threonine/serine dehydratase [Hyphomicrobiales bacterium]MBO6956345.1 threonine/serine dehydratase [Hyphomicrobiales bacterium]
MTIEAPSFGLADIKEARGRIAGETVLTPLISNGVLDDLVGGQVFLKCETLQRTGSFKFRGAYNALAAMSADERRHGVVAVSSGNHAQGIAQAAQLFGIPATIVMPSNAPAIKRERVERLGATVVPYDRVRYDRNILAQEIVERTGAAFVHPYDDVHVMAGQGTLGLEAVDQLNALGLEADIGLVCCGGGGLCAGVSTVWRDAYPWSTLYAVEPEGFDDTVRSFASGKREINDPEASSICDAILTQSPGELTFPINMANHVQGLSVSDDEVLAAVAFAFRELKLVVEPGGAVCLAALLAGKVDVRGRVVLAVLSGGNAEPSMLASALN